MSLKATRSNGGAKRNEISMKAIVQVIPKCPQAKDTRMQRQLAEMETTTSTESAFCWHQRNGLKRGGRCRMVSLPTQKGSASDVVYVAIQTVIRI